VTTHKLEIEYDYDFELYAIRSSEDLYRIAFLLNKQLGCQFKQSLESAVYYEGEQRIPCSYYFWYDCDFEAEWYIIRNQFQFSDESKLKSPDLFSGSIEADINVSMLSKEYRHIDYFVQVFGMIPRKMKESLLTVPKNISEIQTLIKLDVPTMKDRDSFLLFEYANKS